MTADSLPAAFRRTAAIYGAAPAIRIPERDLSFDELDRLTDHLAAALVQRGLNPGDRVGLYCPNGAEFVISYLGLLKAGATLVPINLLLSPGEVRYILDDAGARGLFVHPSLAERAAQATADLDRLEWTLLIDQQPRPDGTPSLGNLLAAGAAIPLATDLAMPDVAVILYTSGTTGFPKGAQLTHANLLANTHSVLRALHLRPGQDLVLVVLPMFHSFAATVGILTPLLHGLGLVPVPRFEPALVCERIESSGATVFLGVPSMYGVLLKLGPAQRAQWRSVRFCVSGGSALPVAVLQDFESLFGIPILEGDGPTECSPVTCVNPLDGVRKPGSVGLPIPDVDMAILDGQGQPLPDGTLGEVCVRGPNVMKGYWQLPQADAESFFGAWFRTGDLGYRDPDGYFFLVDRIKDMMIVNGMNVYPRVLEEVLYRHPGVAEAAVVGEPHPSHGEIPVAYLVPKEGQTLDPSQLRAYCREHLGRHEQPRRLVIRASLPKSGAGKILKRELRRQGEIERGLIPAADE